MGTNVTSRPVLGYGCAILCNVAPFARCSWVPMRSNFSPCNGTQLRSNYRTLQRKQVAVDVACVELRRCGPRCFASRYVINASTSEVQHPKNEFFIEVYKPHQNLNNVVSHHLVGPVSLCNNGQDAASLRKCNQRIVGWGSCFASKYGCHGCARELGDVMPSEATRLDYSVTCNQRMLGWFPSHRVDTL
jgi:hypothetical protein